MRIVYSVIFVLLTMALTLSYAGQSEKIYHFNTVNGKKQFDQLTWELRCLVCQNQNLAESNAPLAADLRQEIANKLNEGLSKQEIITYLVKRYGDYILYKPPIMKTTWLLWFGPFILLIISLIILYLLIGIMRKNKTQAVTLSEEQKMKVQRLLETKEN